MKIPKREIIKELDRIKNISVKLEQQLTKLGSDDIKVEQLTLEEIQDLSKLVGIANFMVTKYADKRDVYHIVKDFADIITQAAQSLEQIDDEITEMIMSAEDSIGRVKAMYVNISANSDLKEQYADGPEYNRSQTSANNLTNLTTEINTSE